MRNLVRVVKIAISAIASQSALAALSTWTGRNPARLSNSDSRCRLTPSFLNQVTCHPTNDT